jgi:hypothetical protein
MSKSITKGAYTGPEAFQDFPSDVPGVIVLEAGDEEVIIFEAEGDYWIGARNVWYETFRARRLPKVAYEVLKAVYA